MTSTPAYLGKVAQPGCCRNVPKKGNGGRGAKSMPCGAEMWLQAASSLPDGGRALRAQEVIDRHIERATHPSTTAVETQRIHDFAGETRSLTALILMSGDSQHFCLENEAMQTAVRTHLHEKRERVELARSMGRARPRQRVFTRSGIDSALTAAALTPAVEIALVETEDDLVEVLTPLVRSIRSSTNISQRQIVKDFQLSERLARAYHRAMVSTASFGSISRVHPCGAYQDASKGFGAQHVPQLVPASVYNDKFHHLLPGVLSMNGRRFVSLAAVKSFGCSWTDAAATLDLPKSAAYFANRALSIINGQALESVFLREITAWVDSLSRQGTPIDYQHRRRLLADLQDLPPQIWSSACGQAGIREGERGRRSRCVAAWLWADLTQGDWRLSPAMKSMADEPRAREIYVKLIAQIADVLPVVRQSGQELLRIEPHDSAKTAPSTGSVHTDEV